MRSITILISLVAVVAHAQQPDAPTAQPDPTPPTLHRSAAYRGTASSASSAGDTHATALRHEAA